MNLDTETICADKKINIYNYLPEIGKEALIDEILAGLCLDKKNISSKFFYDAAGSKLFEAITHLPEYYLTRTEKELIQEAASQIGFQIYNSDIVEIGSGDCSKINILLEGISEEAQDSIRYIPFDVSHAAIEESAGILSKRFPNITIEGVVADFMSQLKLIPKGEKRLFCFFGSTIGNLTRDKATGLIIDISNVMRPGDQLLLGLDRVKDRHILEAAYNDSQAITAAFNRNILNVVNGFAGTNFDAEAFEHIASYDPIHERIEMHLKASKKMSISCPYLKERLVIDRGETIHTENSHKFTDAHIENLEKVSQLKINDMWTDRNNWFSLVQFKK